MAALTDLSDIINRMTGGSSGSPEHIFFYKDDRVGSSAAPTLVNGNMYSLWLWNSTPGRGATPTTGADCTNTTDGGLKQTNAGSPVEKFLLSMTVSSSQAGTIILYDRIAHQGGLDGTLTDAQAVSLTSSRYTSDYSGIEVWAEIYTDLGATEVDITAGITDQAGNTGSIVLNALAGTVTGTARIGGTNFRGLHNIIRLPFGAGQTGAAAVWGVQLSATTGTAGNFGITLARPIASMEINRPGCASGMNFISNLAGTVAIPDNACLALAWMPSGGTTAPNIFGQVNFINK